MNLRLEQVAELLDGQLEGDGSALVNSVSNIENAEPGSISFLANPKYEHFVYSSAASGIIVSRNFKIRKAIMPALIRVDDPYTSFTVLLEEYQKIKSLRKSGIENPVHIGSKSEYGENCYLGAFSYIGDNVKLGNNVKIYPQVYIGDEVTIGDNCIIYPGAKIYERTIIGSYCTIQAGAVIGSHGFGFAPQADGSYKNVPQVGNVILEDHVDIGANTTIDCATLASTIIKEGVKIDNLVQVAHNVAIGEHTAIASQVGISGSTKIGSHVVIGGQVGMAGHIEVANGTKIGGQTGITRSIRENGRVLFGTPAMDKSAYMKSYAIYKKLPEVMERIKLLEQKILTLPQSQERV